MADHVMKKYKAMVEKTIYVAEETLDNYAVGEGSPNLKVVEVDEQEVTIDYWSITSSEELGVDEFMKYKDELH